MHYATNLMRELKAYRLHVALVDDDKVRNAANPANRRFRKLRHL